MSDISQNSLYAELASGAAQVGKYTDQGLQIKAGKIFGDTEDLEAYRDAVLANSAYAKGAQPLNVATKKGKKPKKKAVIKPKEIYEPEDELSYKEYEEPTPELPDLRQVKIFNEFGEIRVFVEAVLECDIALCFVFREKKDLIFIPKTEQMLNIELEDSRQFKVYYPNSLFENYFLAPGRSLMVLFKVQDE